ncbi:MAG: hypothetical protein GY944_07475 [bacterium]|nr:hypothetical protein [bacterium]
MSKRNGNKRKARTVCSEGAVHRLSAGPVSLEQAGAALALQHSLNAPARFAVDPVGEAYVCAELPKLLPRAESLKLAGEALDTALPLLDEGGRAAHRVQAPASSPDMNVVAQLEAGLDASPWTARRREGAAFDLYVSLHCGDAVRVALTTRGQVVRAEAQTLLHASGDQALAALTCFALEANGRLRLARLGVVRNTRGELAVRWQAVLPVGLPVAHGVALLVEAVAHAQSATRRAVVALCSEDIATRYLRLHASAAAAFVLPGDSPG